MEIDVEAQLELISRTTATRLGNGLQIKRVCMGECFSSVYTSLSIL